MKPINWQIYYSGGFLQIVTSLYRSMNNVCPTELDGVVNCSQYFT